MHFFQQPKDAIVDVPDIAIRSASTNPPSSSMLTIEVADPHRKKQVQYLQLATLLPPDSPFFRMPEAAQEKANNEACAAGLSVMFKIRDKPFDLNWTKARFVLKGDKHLMLYAEVFSAAVVGAFTAIHNGDMFPNSRTSLKSDNALIQAAEEAARTRIEDIEATQIAKLDGGNYEKATEPIGDRMGVDDNANPNKKRSHIPVDGVDSRKSFYVSAKIEQPSSMGSASNGEAAATDKPVEPFDPEGAKHSRTAEYIANQYIYKPPVPLKPGEDARHPSVLEYERQTDFKNVFGTGLHGKLTIHDRMRAATDPDCLPDHLTTIWMNDEEKADYEAKRAKELAAIKAKEEAEQKKAANAQLLAEANQRERLRIMSASMRHDYEADSEQENQHDKAKGKSSMLPPFDAESLITNSAASTPTEPFRKAKNRSIIPDSEFPASVPTKEQVDIFNDAAAPVRYYGKRHGYRRDSSVAVQDNGSPIGLVAPHKMRPNSKRISSPAPTMEEVAKKLAKPVTKPVFRKQQRQTIESTEEPIGPREPAKPPPNVRTMPFKDEFRFMSIEGLDRLQRRKKKNTELDFTAGISNAMSSNDSALIHSTPEVSPAAATATDTKPLRKRRRAESEASDTLVVQSLYFQSSQMGTRHCSQEKPPKQSKLRHSGASVASRVSASPAPSLMSPAASDRLSRIKKPSKRQSLPARMMDTLSSAATPAIKRKLSPIQKELTVHGQTAVAAAILRSETPSRRSSSFARATPDKEREVNLDKPVAVTDEEYIVEAILGHKTERDGVYYHVKWEGWDDEKDNTWEPASNLHHAQDILNKYRQGLHVNDEVEDIVFHRAVRKFDSQTKSLIRTFEYLVKWKASSKEFNSWEVEERVRQAAGVKKMIYHRIRENITFGSGAWAKAKTAKAIKLLRDERLEPEKGGRVSAKEFADALKDEDDHDNFALPACEESVYDSAREDIMNQII